jgi:hypothetical protein
MLIPTLTSLPQSGCPSVAMLPWEVEADELDLFKYAAPSLISSTNQPIIPSVRMVLSVQDVALG